MKTRQDSKHFKSKLKYRKWAIEGIFAEAKNLHCLSRARYRSVVKVQILCYLIAIVQNIKRLLKIILIKFYFFNRPSQLLHIRIISRKVVSMVTKEIPPAHRGTPFLFVL
ncbi:MAG: transposase [Gammaproteobacteria bacterium]